MSYLDELEILLDILEKSHKVVQDEIKEFSNISKLENVVKIVELFDLSEKIYGHHQNTLEKIRIYKNCYEDWEEK